MLVEYSLHQKMAEETGNQGEELELDQEKATSMEHLQGEGWREGEYETLEKGLLGVRIMLLHTHFPSISLYLCKTSCPKHNIKLHNYALMITMTTCGTCLWSRYPVLVIIHELEVLTSVEQVQVYSIYYTIL